MVGKEGKKGQNRRQFLDDFLDTVWVVSKNVENDLKAFINAKKIEDWA